MHNCIFIKRYLYSLMTMVIIPLVALTQSSPRQVPAAYPAGTPLNYIRVWDATVPEQSPNNLITRPVTDVKQTTQYFDGLGRALQTVTKQSSPLQNDMVTAIEYDNYGRQSYQYLPFASTFVVTGDTTNNGLFKNNAFAQQAAFYHTANTVSPVKGQDQTFFYGYTKFEASPLHRPIETYAPGNSWIGSEAQPIEGDRRKVDIRFSVNSIGDNVQNWTVTNGAVGTFGTYTATSSAPRELTKLITEDEHGGQTIEFKNKDGNIVLRKVRLTSNPDLGPTSHGHDGWLNTYYLYDNLRRLRCVIQPQGERQMWGIGVLNPLPTAMLSEQCFRYEYDDRDRLIMKQVPGTGVTEMVYDKRDRLVMSRDAKLAISGHWIVNRYDELNRLVQIGLLTNAGSRQSHQTNADGAVGNYPSGIGDLLQENYYDHYDWITSPAQAGISKTVNAADSLAAFFIMTHNTAPDYAQPIRADYVNVNGKPTGSKVRVLGTGTFLHSVTFYDEDARVLQQRGANISGGFDIFTTQYDFAGKPLRVVHRQQKGGMHTRFSRELTKYDYDHMGRVQTVTKKIGTTGVDQVIAANQYDELGQLKKKTVGTNLEEQNYEYNIRGWLLGANRNYVKGTATNKFGFELGYDNGLSIVPPGGYYSQYNGNIGGLTWRSVGDGEKRKYKYTYDRANRLMKAEFNQFNPANNAFDIGAGLDFTTLMGDGINPDSAYDNNGNIKNMRNLGRKTTVSTLIDELLYTYLPNSNKLGKVVDLAVDPNSKLGDFKDGSNTGDDYAYDANGNLIKDENKGISTILYSHLNLPYEIRTPGKGKIVYTYDNLGTKWRKIVYDSTGTTPITTTWTYMHNFVYKNDTLQFFGHEEGRMRCDVNQPDSEPVNYNWDYFIKDHLGNVRMVLTQEMDTAFYPMATIEDSTRPQESLYYDIRTAQVRDVFPVTGDSTTQLTKKFYRVNGNVAGQKTGLGIVLKVMAGDTVRFRADSYYMTPGGNTSNPDIPLTELLSAFANSAAVAPHGVSVTNVTAINGNTNALDDLFNPTPNNTIVNAHLNWVLFDDQFRYTAGDVDGVGSSGNIKNHTKFINSPVIANKNGYLYIFVSNRSNLDVFFDNLVVSHYKGPILEETHYYPFGLTMAAISSKALEKQENKKKFIGQDFEDDLDWNMYQFRYRIHDPQLGRFIQIDPLSDKYVYNSTYAYAENRVINGIDLEGLEFFGINPGYFTLLGNKTTIVRSPVVENAVKAGTETGKNSVEHHVITRQSKTDPVVQAGREGGFKFEGAENKMPIEPFSKSSGQGRHGNHPNYNAEIQRRLSDFKKDNPNASPQQAAEFLRNTVKEMRDVIQNNPNTKVNDLFKPSMLTPVIDGINLGLPVTVPDKVGPKPEPPPKVMPMGEKEYI